MEKSIYLKNDIPNENQKRETVKKATILNFSQVYNGQGV